MTVIIRNHEGQAPATVKDALDAAVRRVQNMIGPIEGAPLTQSELRYRRGMRRALELLGEELGGTYCPDADTLVIDIELPTARSVAERLVQLKMERESLLQI